MQGRHAKATAKTKLEASAAAPNLRLPSHSGFTCFTARAVASANTPRQHTGQQQMQAQLQPMSDGQSGTALQADASARYHQQHQLTPFVSLQRKCAIEDQTGCSLAAMPTGLASLDNSAQTAVSILVPSSSPVPREAESASSGPNLGSPGAAGVSPALGTPGAARAVLQEPATPSWQGLLADTPPTPLSSHPIDALDESESAPSGTDSSALSPANSRDRSVPAENQQSGPNTPVGLHHQQCSADSTFGNIGQQSLGQAVSQHAQQQTAHHSQQQQQQQQQASTLSGAQTSAEPQHRQASSSLDSDAVVLDFASELSGSNNGLISPSSSVASWQRALSQLGSESSQKFTPLLSQTREQAFASSQQNSPEALWSRPGAVSSRASAHSPGLFPDFAPIFGSTPLPGAWQQHHLPSPSSSRSPTGCQQDPSTEQPLGSAWEPYSEAAAQLRAAVNHAVKLLTVPQAAPADLRADSSNTAAVQSSSSLSLSSDVPMIRSQEQCQLSCEGFQQPYRRDAFRRSAQSSSSEAAAIWVPQAEIQMQSCAEGASLQINGTSPSFCMTAVTCDQPINDL